MKRIVPWVTAAIILVTIFGTIYVVVQQVERSNANQPQIELAQNIAMQLMNGANPHMVVSGRVDMNTSLAPFILIYDHTGHVVAGNGFLNNALPEAPLGFLQAATTKQYNSVTWQPIASVRIAAVSIATKTYYVVSGRSLREVEKNESNTLKLSACGGLLSFIVLGLGYLWYSASSQQ